MRKEFRIVATKYEHHNITGKEYYIDGVSVRTSSFSYCTIFQDLEVAKRELEFCKKDLAKWEGKHNLEAMDEKDGVIIHYSAVRIESREVSDWKEVSL